jgi:proteic killer suppression protein
VRGVLELFLSIAMRSATRFDFHAMRGTPRRYSIHVNGPWGITFES